MSLAGSKIRIDTATLVAPSGEETKLVPVLNPFGRSAVDGVDLNELLHADPAAGNQKLDAYVAATREAIAQAKGQGILYILEGARAGCCSPMQYGGYYLERDRELLAEITADVTTVLAVVGGEDVFLDFVSDLPAQVFAWDAPASGFTASYVRGLREGIQASSDPESEIALIGSLVHVPDTRSLTQTHV